MTRCRSFLADERGSAAVDWVVMTAAVVVLSLAVVGAISDAVESAGLRLATRLHDMPIRTSFADWAALRSELATQAEAEAEAD